MRNPWSYRAAAIKVLALSLGQRDKDLDGWEALRLAVDVFDLRHPYWPLTQPHERISVT